MLGQREVEFVAKANAVLQKAAAAAQSVRTGHLCPLFTADPWSMGWLL